jgi:hypothetical protein
MTVMKEEIDTHILRSRKCHTAMLDHTGAPRLLGKQREQGKACVRASIESLMGRNDRGRVSQRDRCHVNNFSKWFQMPDT